MAGKAKVNVDQQGTGGQAQAAAQLMQAMAQQQREMATTLEKVMSSLSENIAKMSSISQHMESKQDVGSDEAYSVDATALSRLVNNSYANHANVAATRSQSNADVLATLVQMQIANANFAMGIMQNAIVADIHQQCGSNSAHRKG